MSQRDAHEKPRVRRSPRARGVASQPAGELRGLLQAYGGYALLAAAAGLAAMLVVRLVVGLATPAELYGDALTRVMPLDLFSALLTFLGRNAKHIFYVALVVGQGLVTTAVVLAVWGVTSTRPAAQDSASRGSTGGLAAGARGPQPATAPPTRRQTLALCLILWGSTIVPYAALGAVEGISLAQLGQNVLAMLVAAVIPAAATGIVFAALLWRGTSMRTDRASAVESPSRRRFLNQLGLGLVAIAGGVAAWRFLFQGGAGFGGLGSNNAQLDTGSVPARVTPPVPQYGSWTPITGQPPEITSNSEFYYVSKNLVGDPALDAKGWHLSITGMVRTPLTLTYDQLRGLSSVAQYQTLECISNEVGGNLMSTAQWTGTRLADVLAAAGIQPGASQLVFRCADGYSDSLHLTQALGSRALIAYRMNGQPLAQAHGFPARLLIPGLYGMKNGKWVESLEVSAGRYDGYWEQRGWTREAIVKLTARIDVPGDGDVLAQRPTMIAGVAFAGDQGVGQVDVSTDAGHTWIPAQLKLPLAEQTWVLWELPWTPTLGSHVLAARAIDLSGRVQSPRSAPPLPDGASGYHTITVHVG
jgi:DMSO/TMAO reductase YedYZ molybdopterin-dependent catalytic subunit